MQPTLRHPLFDYTPRKTGMWNAAAVFDSPRLFVHFVIAAIFILNVDLVWPVLVPTLPNITVFGEVAYINNGRNLVEGMMPPFSYSPLSALLYGLTYLPFQSSPYWLVYSCWAGRVLLFVLLWTSSYLVAQAYIATETLATLLFPLITIALVFVSPALVHLITHGSHALFAAMSAFALWQLLLFYRSRAIRHLVGCSLLVGLSALARSGEGIILWICLIVLSLWFARGVRGVATALAASVLPCASILGCYIFIYFSVTGTFDLGMSEYSYFTFEQGHGLAYQTQYDETANFYVEGQIDARRLFGTPEENHHSILTAIMRNPQAYLQRVPRLMKLVPLDATLVYGGTLGLVFFLFAARGVVELGRRKLYALLAILLFWSSYTAVYPLLVFQPTHFLMPYYIVFVLAAVGLSCAIGNCDSRRERYFWYATFTGLIVTGFIFSHANVLSMFVFLLVDFAIIWMMMRHYRGGASIETFGLVLVMAGLLMHGRYPEPKFPTLGSYPEDKATLFMREHLQPLEPVGAYAPKNVWMAKMTYIPMFRAALPHLKSPGEFSDWMSNNHLRAIYVDPYLKALEPAVWAFVQSHVGQDLEVAFRSDNGDFQVLFVRSNRSEALRRYVDRPWYSSKERFLEEAEGLHLTPRTLH